MGSPMFSLEVGERDLIRAVTVLVLELGAERVLALADQIEHSAGSSYNEPERLAGTLRLVARAL